MKLISTMMTRLVRTAKSISFLLWVSHCSSSLSFTSAFGFGHLRVQVPVSASSASVSTSSALQMAKAEDLPTIARNLNDAILKCQPEFIKTCKVEVSTTATRLGLIATNKMKKGDLALAIPYDEQIVFTPDLARKNVFKDILPAKYDGWTRDNGFLALLLLNELAKTGTAGQAGIPKPIRKPDSAALIQAWIAALPSYDEMKKSHPYLWSENDQEVLQSSSTKKVYKLLDDIEDDFAWLDERIFSTDRDKFPETVELNGESYPCFNLDGFTWAMAIAASRSIFVDGSSQLIPVMDMANHDDIGVEEVRGGFMGTFGTTKGIVMRTAAGRTFEKGQEVLVSYGPKSAAEYLLEHGFVPKVARALKTSVAEITFAVDQEDRFYDDKIDILEFDTYDNAPMEPTQSFDVVSEVGRDGEPDPAMIQFLRLLKLNAKDAFLLESIFRAEVWEFMAYPVSEPNERAVLEAVVDACTKALSGTEGVESTADDDENSPTSLCAVVRASERRALSRTLEYVSREKEALDLKEYYQERRLKDLGLDSNWSPEDAPAGGNPNYPDDDAMSFGQTRAPGSLDW